MVEHLADVPTSEALIQSLADQGIVAPAPPSDAASPLQLDTLKLPSSLTALAAPFAAAVARAEALTMAEVEQDAWLHDTLVNFSVIARKFIDVSSALKILPAAEPAADRCSERTSRDVGAQEGAWEADGAQKSADTDTGASSKVPGEDGAPSVSFCQAQRARTDSSASAYDSSAAGSSDGSVAAGSVSVNHNGINSLNESSSVVRDRCTSEQQGPLETATNASHHCEEAGAALKQDVYGCLPGPKHVRQDIGSSFGAQAASISEAGSCAVSGGVDAPSVASVTSGNGEHTVETPLPLAVDASRTGSGEMVSAISGSDTDVVATVASADAAAHVGEAGNLDAAGNIKDGPVVSEDAVSAPPNMNEAADGDDLKGTAL